jgi:hypothetical protein
MSKLTQIPDQPTALGMAASGAYKFSKGLGKGAYAFGKQAHSLQNKVNPLINKAARGFNKAAGLKSGGFGGAMLAADMAITGYSVDATYDPTVHDSRLSEFGKTFLSSNLVELGLTAAVGMLGGGAIGGAIAVGSMALSAAGFGPGEFIKTKMDTMGREFDNERYGRGPTKQNEQTNRATNQNMSLLGQAGFGGNEVINPQSFAARQRGLLGSEAMLMHN